MTLITLNSFLSLSQTQEFEEKIQQLVNWQERNLNIEIINQKYLIDFSEFELSKLSGKYIVYNENIQIRELDNFDKLRIQDYNDKINKSSSNVLIGLDTEKSLVESWLKKHPNIIIKKISQNNENNNIDNLTSNNCIYIKGENIKWNDVEKYMELNSHLSE